MRSIIAVLFIATMLLAGCGENQNTVTPGEGIQPPQNVMAYSSAVSGAVALSWTAPAGSTDSLFGGYVIQWTGGKDSVVKALLRYTATGLPAGVTQFLLFSKLVDGTRSSTGAVISWAPADRHSNIQLYEFRGALSSGASAVDLKGAAGGTPVTYFLDNNSDSADFYLYAGYGQVGAPVQLVSASIYLSSLKTTNFSTVTDSSPTLDFPRTSFPAPSTFTQTSVVATSGTIYYAQLEGPYYARILVTSVNGSSPSQYVILQVSVQHVQNIPFAEAPPAKSIRSLSFEAPVKG